MAHYTLSSIVSEAGRTSAYGHSTASDTCLDENGMSLGMSAGFVKGFGCRPLEGQRGVFGGRRPKASKGGNRAGGTQEGAACSS